ncbi:MAG: hypothetical protein LBI02_03775 [Opitutaceae bacterium]|jgi:hypothetical protein|nr:hypothetical protein [Opitutaceae bacterium]
MSKPRKDEAARRFAVFVNGLPTVEKSVNILGKFFPFNAPSALPPSVVFYLSKGRARTALKNTEKFAAFCAAKTRLHEEWFKSLLPELSVFTTPLRMEIRGVLVNRKDGSWICEEWICEEHAHAA